MSYTAAADDTRSEEESRKEEGPASPGPSPRVLPPAPIFTTSPRTKPALPTAAPPALLHAAAASAVVAARTRTETAPPAATPPALEKKAAEARCVGEIHIII